MTSINKFTRHNFIFLFLSLIITLFTAKTFATEPHLTQCEKALIQSKKAPFSGITEKELEDGVLAKINQVREFQFIRETAKNLGIRVWLFGGTATGFINYVKWDLARSKGLMELQEDRFDYDFTNIFRSTQDLDIVVDATADVAEKFQNTITNKFPYFLGSKANAWEVRTLKNRLWMPGQTGFKEALLNDIDFNSQNTDSSSVGMVEISLSTDPIVRDLKSWNSPTSIFLKDTLKNQISYFRSDLHFTTARAKLGENPEILSVLRLLVKAFQYELSPSTSDLTQIKEIVDQFNPLKIENATAKRRIQDTAKKLILHAVNLEYAFNKLDELGLRKKLIAMGNPDELDSFAWWLNKEPLRSKPIGQGQGKTAQELNIHVVAHTTNSFLAYESITRAHSGEPNVLISRNTAEVTGEGAIFGDGFYTLAGRDGKPPLGNSGLTIRFAVDPLAREGTDFKTVYAYENKNKPYVVFKNKKALKVIQESLHLGLDDFMHLAETNNDFQIDGSDVGLFEKLKRRLNAAGISDELERLFNSQAQSDHSKLSQVLIGLQGRSISKIISQDLVASTIKNIYKLAAQKAQSSKENDIFMYLKTVGPVINFVDRAGLLDRRTFVNYLDGLINSHCGFDLRKEAVFEILLNSENFENYLSFKKTLSAPELRVVTTEISEWGRSSDPRKRRFALDLNKRWSEAIEKDDVKGLESLIATIFFDINHRNLNKMSLLQLAAYYNSSKIIDWLVANHEFHFNAKNALGYTEVEQLKLIGKDALAKRIEQLRPDAKGRSFKLVERNIYQKTKEYPNGTPLVSFVRIEPGTFVMGSWTEDLLDWPPYLTTITKPFEYMSVPVTQKLFLEISNLARENRLLVNGRDHTESWSASLDYVTRYYSKDSSAPSNLSNYSQTVEWIAYLNKLSNSDSPQVQNSLAALLPGHIAGAVYRLPTEAEWEFSARLGGVAEGKYPHSNDGNELEKYIDYDFHKQGIGAVAMPVGSKFPVFYNGHPLYDLTGNVPCWVSDWYGEVLSGGVDPTGPKLRSGYHRVVRGGGASGGESLVTSGFRIGVEDRRENGFRIVREIGRKGIL